uniref:Uncharacterized protein n=1 Tax=Romanomermis culicivorax TaxID=13658 RepID=A0A915HS86_ROMCU
MLELVDILTYSDHFLTVARLQTIFQTPFARWKDQRAADDFVDGVTKFGGIFGTVGAMHENVVGQGDPHRPAYHLQFVFHLFGCQKYEQKAADYKSFLNHLKFKAILFNDF